MDEVRKSFLTVLNKFHTLERQQGKGVQKADDMSSAEFFMLAIVSKCKEQKLLEGRADEGVSPSEVLGYMECSMSAVSKMIRNMEGKGFIERITSTKDRRITYLEITEKGNQVLKDAWEKRDHILNRIMQRLGEDNMQMLTQMLENVYETMKEEIKRETEEQTEE